MTYQIEFTPAAAQELRRIGPEYGRWLLRFLRTSVSANPRSAGERLQATVRELWRYRVGMFQIVAGIEDARQLVLVVKVGHRGEV